MAVVDESTFCLLILVSVCISSITSQAGVCPKRSSTEVDTYKVQDRLNKILGDLGQTKFISQDHKHSRPDAEKSEEKSDVYDYSLQLCTPVGSDAAVLQNDKTAKTDVLIGKSTSSFALGGTDWILLIYKDGTKYKSYCDGQSREAWVKLVCERSGKKPTFKVIEESRWKNGNKKKGCYYLFELNHKDACSPKPASKLGGGAIFIIVSVSLFGAYLLFGFLYQRFVRGAKGVEQMPNYSFWRSFGNLTADGCDYVCRRPDHPASSYKGMADALDIDSSEDERDDHLLPM